MLEEARDNDEVVGCLFLTLDDEDMLTLTSEFAKADRAGQRRRSVDAAVQRDALQPLGGAHGDRASDPARPPAHPVPDAARPPHHRATVRRLAGRDAPAWSVRRRTGSSVEVEDWLPELGAAAIEARVRQRGLDFTAILAAGDSLAVGAAIGLERLGYKVPDDVSVMGMDDLPQAAFHTPPLTTMHIPMREIGAAALNLLLDDLGGFAMPPRRVELACHLVERQSTARPR